MLFQKDTLRFDIGVSIFLGGVLLYEILRVVINVSGFWQGLLLATPLYFGIFWGGCGYVLPEYWRLERGAENSPSLWKLRNVMRLGLILLLASSSAFANAYSVSRQIFHQEFVYSPLVALVLRIVFVSGVLLLGVTALWSKRLTYGWYPRPRTPWSITKILGLTSMIMLIAGVIITQVFAVLGIGLLAGGAITYLAERIMRDRPMTGITNARILEPIKLEAGKFSFERRLNIGKKISEIILRKHGKKILAVYIWGPSADEKEESVHYLDLAVIVREREQPILEKKFVFDGIEVVVSYWYESSFLRRAKEFDESWPAYRTRYSNLTVLYDRDDWTRHVKTAIGESDKADSTDAIRVTALDIVRHIGILGDNVRKGDPRDIREDCDVLASVCLNLLFLLNHKPYPTGDFWKGISEFPIKPADLITLVDSAKGNIAVGQKAMAEAAMRLAHEMLEMVRLRGIAIESAGPLV